jgi:hypothetical protein
VIQVRQRAMLLDAGIAATLFVAALIVGSLYVRSFDASGRRTQYDFGQYEFAAAVALTCGDGFVNVAHGISSALDDFLAVKIDRLSCRDLPPSFPPNVPDFTQRLYRYLLYAVSAVWRLRGVSWSALWPLFGICYGATITLTYGVVRLAVGRVAGAVAASAFMVSAIHLAHLPMLRDYTKAPFMMALILLMAYSAIAAPRSRGLLLTWSAVFGIVLGLGFGFRNDMLIVIPPFVVAILCWTLPRSRQDLVWRLSAIGVAALAFAGVAWPILSGYSQGSNTGHTAVLGLMPTFEIPLGITPSVYEWGYAYVDRLVDAMVTSHAWHTSGRSIGYLSSDYDAESVRYLIDIVRNWPADILVRAYAAVLKIVEFPFTIGIYTPGTPDAVRSAVAAAFYAKQQAALRLLQQTGLPLVVVSLGMVSTRGVRRALLILCALLYFAGYPAIQFQVRHFFHLEFIGWLALVFVLERLVEFAKAICTPGPTVFTPKVFRPAAFRVLIFGAITVALVFAPITAARAYQQPHVRSLLRVIESAAREPIGVRAESRGDVTVLAPSSLWSAEHSAPRVRSQYLIAEFSPACGAVKLPVTFRYAAPAPPLDLSYETVVSLSAGPVQMFFPVYDTDEGARFVGVELRRGEESCMKSLMRVADSGAFVQPLNLTLPSEWSRAALYQTITSWERQPLGEDPAQRIRTQPRRLLVTKSQLTAPVAELPTLIVRAPLVHADSLSQWTIRGTAESPTEALLGLAPERRTPTDRFVVQGQVRRGGVTIGLLRGDVWADDTNLTVDTPGAFSLVFAPRNTDEYGVLITNAGESSWLQRNSPSSLLPLVRRLTTSTDVRIAKAGWIK